MMSITRAGRILTAIYFRLVERGIDSYEAAEICVHIDPDIIRTHKDQAVEMLVDDIVLAHKELEAKLPEPLHAFAMLIHSMDSHHERNQLVY